MFSLPNGLIIVNRADSPANFRAWLYAWDSPEATGKPSQAGLVNLNVVNALQKLDALW
jgi:hypothetical protein